MKQKREPRFDPSYLAVDGPGKVSLTFRKGRPIFTQGDPADAVFYIRSGKIKLTVLSAEGREAVLGILGGGDFFGEGCLAGQQLRMATAMAMVDSTVLRVERQVALKAMREHPDFAGTFVAHLLSRNIRIEEDLADQLFNSSEKRLARTLLLLARFGKDGRPEKVIPKVSQETLAEMVGTTRSRVSYFMNKFRKLGFIRYNGEIEVHSSLLNFLLHDSSGRGPEGLRK
jgi:CRP/FNR family transcriptional regulator, cyclic AMP receptor protein